MDTKKIRNTSDGTWDLIEEDNNKCKLEGAASWTATGGGYWTGEFVDGDELQVAYVYAQTTIYNTCSTVTTCNGESHTYSYCVINTDGDYCDSFGLRDISPCLTGVPVLAGDPCSCVPAEPGMGWTVLEALRYYRWICQ